MSDTTQNEKEEINWHSRYSWTIAIISLIIVAILITVFIFLSKNEFKGLLIDDKPVYWWKQTEKWLTKNNEYLNKNGALALIVHFLMNVTPIANLLIARQVANSIKL